MEYDWLGFGYAALVAAGGVVGYAKAGSVPSLAAGLLFGGLAGLGAYQQSKDPKNVWLSLADLCPFICTNVSGGRTGPPGSIGVRAQYLVLNRGLSRFEGRVGEKYLSPLPD
ncbi:Transmembrane protein 14C [Pitangus sulphuratus]|nr:Transmembrane protein 14C [Pitangus sulphuratus]